MVTLAVPYEFGCCLEVCCVQDLQQDTEHILSIYRNLSDIEKLLKSFRVLFFYFSHPTFVQFFDTLENFLVFGPCTSEPVPLELI